MFDYSNSFVSKIKKRYRSRDMSNASHESDSTKSLYLIFFATFIFGLIAGAILFLQSTTGGEGDAYVSEKDAGNFSIVAYAYGGCTRIGCPSYRILQNGSYIYLTRQEGDGKYSGEMSEKDMQTIRTQLQNTDFASIGASSFAGTCPITYDGVAYRFNIDYKGNQYTFDSCVEDLESPFFTTLSNYFEVFNTAHIAS